MSRSKSIAPSTRRGFTLIELLVVLLILTAVTTIAIRSTAKIEDRSRIQRTEQVLLDVERAVAGSVADQLHSDVVAAYLADTGELPRDLHDLWVRPAAVEKAAFHSIEGGAGALMLGWNGPYLDLPIALTNPSAAAVLDGFGDAISIVKDPLDAASLPALQRWLVRATLPDGSTRERVLLDELADPETAKIDRVLAAAHVEIVVDNPGGAVWANGKATAYGPANGALKEFPGAPSPESPAAFEFPKSLGLTPGNRAFRGSVDVAGTTTHTYTSDVAYVRLIPGKNLVVLKIVVPVGPQNP